MNERTNEPTNERENQQKEVDREGTVDMLVGFFCVWDLESC